MQSVLVDRAPLRLRRPARLLRLASDERLVALVRAGDEDAFEAIYDRHHPAILGFCRHMLGTREEAEDAVQHTFLAAFRDLATSEKPIELRPWLFAIARNRCLSLLRARRAHVAIELAEPSIDGLAATIERREDVRELLLDLASLPEDQRAALLLAELGALDHAGIATVLGCPREKVKALVFQARTSLAANREARATPCDEIRLELSTASGAALRRGPLRRHLRTCDGCRAFKAEVAVQGKLLAFALPVVPSMALKGSVLSGAFGGAVSGGGAAGAGSATAGAASGGTFGVLGGVASTGAGKVAISLAVAGAMAGGGTLTERFAQHPTPSSSPATAAAPSPVPVGLSLPSVLPEAPATHRRALGTPAARSPARHRPLAPGGAADSSGGTVAPQVPPETQPPHESPIAPVTRAPADPARAPQTAAGHKDTTPRGHQGTTSPGHDATPPGHAQDDSPSVTPPGHGGTPPGQSKKPAAPPGQSNAPNTPPGQSKAPKAPPGQSKAPSSEPPPDPGSGPPGQSGAPHGNKHY